MEEPQGSYDSFLGKPLDNSGNSEKGIGSRLMLSLSPVLYTLKVFWKKTGCVSDKRLVFESYCMSPIFCAKNVAAICCHKEDLQDPKWLPGFAFTSVLKPDKDFQKNKSIISKQG